MSPRACRVAAVILLTLGLGRMLADLAGWRAVSGLLGVSMVAPAPKVFSQVRGLETFSTRFFLEWTGTDGAPNRLEIDSQRYARLRGPYQRRNVYGAALAYGPVLDQDPRGRPMLEAVLRYGLGAEAPLLVELGIDPAEIRGPVRVRYEPRAGSELDGLRTRIEAPLPVEASR